MVRAPAAAALTALLLAACGGGDDRAPFADSRTPPGLAARFLPPEGWAWGLVQVGEAPAQRYGVSSPAVVPRAHVLVVPGLAESAEAWFETARDLNARGYTVWVLDRAGQGGSGRLSGRRDLIHAKSLDPDVDAVRAMERLVIRPSGAAPLVVLAQGDGAATALRAAQTGLAADAVFLSAPDTPGPAPGGLAGVAARLGLGALLAPGSEPWRRDGPDALARGLTHDPWRGRVQQAWQMANPDLRMSGPSLQRQAAAARLRRDAEQRADAVRPPVSVMAAPEDAAARALCAALPRCTFTPIAGAKAALHLEADRFRRPWLDAIQDVTDRAAAGRRAGS